MRHEKDRWHSRSSAIFKRLIPLLLLGNTGWKMEKIRKEEQGEDEGKRWKEEERGGKRRRKEEEEEDKGKNRMTEANGLKIRNSPPIVLLEGGGWGVEGGGGHPASK